ncbi:MAG: hypothetical protein LBP39_02020 [Rickettsiales bacterium]|jgi:predicted amidohydrolase|nr:hypothetical protein [Rickettsiales bacterium]
MKIGIARLYTKNADLEYNFCNIERLYLEAVDKNLEFIIFPRLSLSGFSVDGNFSDNDYIKKVIHYFEKIVKLTENKKLKILIGSISYEESCDENGNIFSVTRRDSAFFIDCGYIDTEISRKEIDKNNATEDYRYFDREKFLEYFSYGKKKFSVLLSDDIYSNFNIFLLKDSRPNYIICLDSSLKPTEFIKKHIIKLAKLVNCPVFYTNSASYIDGLLFRGNIILVDEDFEVKKDDVYGKDEIIIFEIDCEDGTELLLAEEGNRGEYNKFCIMEKYFGCKNVVIDLGKFPDFSPNEIKNFNYDFITFDKTNVPGVRYIDLKEYINPKLFSKLSADGQNFIKSKIVDLCHDSN